LKIKVIDSNSIKIKGNIKNLDHFDEIQESITSLISKKTEFINIDIIDSLSLPSSYVFFLLDIQKKYKLNIYLNINNQKLFDTLKRLGLDDRFFITLGRGDN
jgi:hypothetical protein